MAAGSSESKKAFDGKSFARRLTTSPGVYLMRDDNDKPLYVGKAKNLRKRVASYFDGRPKNARIMLMASRQCVGFFGATLTGRMIGSMNS